MRFWSSTKTLSPGRAADEFFAGRLIIVDVRGAREVAQARIPGATHLPLGELDRRLSELPGDRPIAFLCRSGHRSALAARRAAKHHRDVASIDGGMEAWTAANLPTASDTDPNDGRRTG